MENKNFTNIETVIRSFIQGNASPDDEKMICDWIRLNPDYRKTLFQEKDIWESAKLGSTQLNSIELEQWQALQKRIQSNKIQISRITEGLKIAAIIIISLGLGWFGRYLYSLESFLAPSTEMKSIEATKGQLKEIFLADGTHVWLNSESKLSFPSEFDSNNRKVELKGEAYFEVTANEQKPFLVRTENHTVIVVGTHFNICEYPDSKIIETTLEEGKVKIITGNIIHDLLPGEQSSFNTETSIVRISKADLDIYTSWKDGRYDFNNEKLGKIFQIIERWWDVKINYPEKLKNERISGVLRRYKPIEQHLEVIQQLIPLEFKIANDVVIIK